ncbi:MAG TPA: Ig-like domain-containing protein [Gaiellaceae bacterium]
MRARGYAVETGAHQVAITSLGGGFSPWHHFRGGATRTTRYGLETIAVGRDRTEEFLTVTSGRAPSSWRWRLDTNARPTLGRDGSVRLAGGLRVRPVEILDVAGRKVTPPGLRWSLGRKAGTWFLGLRLDDSKLPLPYVIDPAVDYPATQYLSSSIQAASTTLTAVTAYTLNAPAPSTACTKIINPQPDCVGLKYATSASPYPAYYEVNPGSFNVNGTRVAPPSTTPDGKGWIVDLGGTAAPTDTAIPAGTWTFNVHTLATGTSTGGTIHLVAGVWKVATTAGAITASTNYLDPGSAAAEETSTNLVAAATDQTVNLGVNLPEISLAANEHILVQLYLKQSAAMTTQRTVGIVSGDANSWISHPAATTRPSVPTLQTPTAGLLLKTTTPTFGATFVDSDAGDTGRVNFRVCSDINCATVLQTFSSGSGNASGTTVYAQVPSAMTDNTTYYWQVQGQDASGVTSAWSAGRLFVVNTAGISADVTAPSTPGVAVAENPAGANQFVSGTTLYYKSGGAGGSFDVTATGTTDAESGVHHVAFPAISGVTGGGNVAVSPWVKTYTWNSSSSASGAQNVTSVNNAGLTSANAPFTVTADAAGPSGGSVSYAGGFTSSTSVSITTADGTDSGAGVDTTTRLIERDSATLTNGTCGSFSGSWTTVTSPNTVTTGNCYVYRFTVADNVGNPTTYTSPSVVKVDTTSPAAPTLSLSESSPLSFLAGTTLYYNPQGSNSGSFTVDATASDPQSGIASVDFPVVFGTDSSTDSSSPYQATYSWIASSSASGAKNVTATNNTSLSSGTTSFTITPDTAAPSGGSVTYANGYNTSGSVTISTANGTDPLSGLDLSSALLERQTTSLTNGSCGSFTNPWTTVTSPDTVASGTCAKYRYTIADNVGNPTTYTSSNVVKVDTTAPAAPPLTLSKVTGTQWEHVSGTTLYYNAQAANAGSFTVDAAASDTESGVTSVTFPVVFGADGLTDATSPYQRTYSWTAAAVASGAQNVTALNNAGLTSSNSPFTVTKDVAAPGSGSITYPNGYDTTGSIALTIDEGTDAGSGIASVSTLIERNSAPLTNGNCGSYVGWTTVSNPDTTVATGNCYQYRVTVKDNVGNTAAPYTSANVVKEDRTSPAGPTLSLAESSALEFVSGSTLFYNPQGSNSGSFTVTAATSDGESGISSVGFPAVFGADSSSDSTSPYSASYSWTASSSASGQKTITATNNAGLPSTDTFTVTPDTSAPSGGSVSYSNGYASGSVTVTTADGNDGGSGIDTSSRLIERDAVALTNGSCGSFTGAWTTVSSLDSTIASGNCYIYRYTVADNVGNPVTYTSPNVVKVDTTAPNAPTLSFGSFTNASATGSTVFFRTGAAGGFTVTAAASDLQSGIASRSFPALGTGWSGTPSGADDAYTFTSSAVDPVEPNNVSATNNAGLPSGNTPFTVTADGTPPATSVTCNAGACSAGWYTSSVTVALSATDAGSGLASIKYTTDGSDPSPVNGTTYAGSFVVAATTTVKFRAYDAVGNAESVGSQLVRIDTVAPTGSLTAPAGGSALHGTVTVSSDPADGNSGVASAAFQRSPAGTGTWTAIGTANGSPYQTSWDTTGVGDGSYDLRVVTTDVAGNPFTSAVRTVTVDNTNPSGTLTDPGANLRGSAPLSGTGSDGSGSGVASVAFQRSAAGAGSWTTISTDSTSPYAGTWDTTGVSDGLYDLRVLVNDVAGNSAASAIVTNRRVDNTNPSGSLTAPAASAVVRGAAVTVSSNSTDSGSGVGTVSFERSPAGANIWTAIGSDSTAPYSVSWNTTSLSDGSFDLRAVTTDVAGNALTSGTVTVTVDNTNPTGSITAPAGGAIVTGSSVTVSSDSADPLSGVSSVAFQRSAAGANSWTTIGSDTTSPYAVSFDSTGVADGNYDLRAVTTDAAGNSFTSAVVTITVDNSAPAAPSLAFGTFANASATGSTVYYRPGVAGAFTVTASASDSVSGIASYGFPALPFGWTPSGTASSRVYAYIGTPTEPGSGQSVTATNGAGLTSPESSFAVTADATAPSTSITCGAGACSAGWDTSSVTVALSATDAGSGLASIKYTTDGSDPSPVNGTVYSGSFSLAATATVKYRAYDAVGNEETVGSKLVRIDSGSPTGSLTAPGNGSVLRSTVTVSSDSADPNSGVASAIFQRSPAGVGSWTTIATVNGSPFQTSLDTAGLTDGSYDLRVVTSDVAGNTFTSPVRTVTVDNTSPSGSLTDPGATLGATVGLSANASDATSGVASAAFQRSPAGTSTWTTISTDTSAPFAAAFDTTSVTDGLYDLQVVITDVAGNTYVSPVVANRRVDNTAPSANMGNPGSPLRGTVVLGSSVTDNGSGVGTIGYEYSPAGANSWTATTASWNTTLVSDGLYDLHVVATDVAGNTVTSSAVTSVRVDNTAPSVSLDDPGSPIGGSITLDVAASDSGSGLASVVYQRSLVDQNSWTTIGTASGNPFSLDFDTTAVSDGSYDLRAIATDAAGNSTTSALVGSRVIDNTPADVLIGAPADGAYVSSSSPDPFTITASSTDSSVAEVEFFQCSDTSAACSTGSWVSLGTDSTSPYSISWTLPAGDGLRALRAVTTDTAGNHGSDAVAVTIDRQAPAGGSVSYADGYATGAVTVTADSGSDSISGVNAASAVLQRDEATLTNGSCGSFSGSWSAVSSPDSTVGDGHCYAYRLRVADNAGNFATSTSANVVKVDTLAPTVAQDDPGANLRGLVALTASAADSGGSGVASVVFERSVAGADSWTAVGSDPSAPYSFDFDTSSVSDGLYDLRAVVTDRAGHQTASTLIAGARVDNTAPTAVLDGPGSALSGTVTLDSQAGDAGSGVASLTYQYSPAGAGTWTSIAASWNTTSVPDGLYDLRVVVADVAGNSTASPAAADVRVDNTAPSVALDDLGTAVHGTVSLSANATDAGSGIDSVTYQYSPAGSNSWTATPASWSTSALAEGMYDLRARATDLAGNSAYSTAETVQVDNTAPVALMDDPGSPLDGTVTLGSHSSDSGSGISSEVFQYSPANMDSWTSLGGTDWDTTAVPQGRYDLRVVVTDAAGNVTDSDPVRNRAVSSSGISVTILSPGAVVASEDGDPFTIEATSPDAADLLGIQFFACDNQSVNCVTGNWVSLGTDSTDPYTVPWTVPADGSRALRAVATSTSHAQATDVLNTLVDRTAPSGGSVSYAGGYSIGPVTISGIPGVDAGIGVDLASTQLERDDGTLAGGSCSFTGSWQAVSSPDSALANGHCYRYRYRVRDLAGNTALYTSANVVKADTGAPAVSLADPGANLLGTASLDATSTDSESGVASVTFQRSPAGAATWTTIGTDSGAPFSLAFDTTAVSDGLYDLRAIATDAAGNQEISALVTGRRVDNTAPDLTFNGPADGERVWGSLALGASASDAGSGLASITFRCRAGGSAWAAWSTQTTPPFDYSWDSQSVADGPAEIQVLASDALGNQSSVTRTVIVDNDPPTVALDTVPPFVSGSLPLHATASADTTSVLFQIRPAGGSWADLAADVAAPYTAVVDTTTLTDAHYDFRAVATDAAGHTSSSVRSNVLLDNTAPSGSMTAPGSGAAVSTTIVHLAASASDAGSGLVSVTFQQRPAGGAWSQVAVDANAPYEADWNRGGLPDGAYEVRAVLLDAVGNSVATAPSGLTLATGTSPPPPAPPPPAKVPFTFSAGNVTFVAPRGSSLVFLSLPLQLSREARVESSLLKGKKKTMRKWLNRIPAGNRILKLGIPKKLLKKGTYTLVLAATTADGSRVQCTVVVRAPAKFKVAKKR